MEPAFEKEIYSPDVQDVRDWLFPTGIGLCDKHLERQLHTIDELPQPKLQLGRDFISGERPAILAWSSWLSGMYWPTGAPRRYVFGHDGEYSIPPRDSAPDESIDDSAAQEKPGDANYVTSASNLLPPEIVDLRVARNGAYFGTITKDALFIWQTRPTAVLTSVHRSTKSFNSYGPNKALFIRPDSGIFVVQTMFGYLITYSLALDSYAKVYVTHLPVSGHRRKSSLGGNHAEDVGIVNTEDSGLRDASLQFKMVIKVDAGIKKALAMDKDLMVATEKPAAVQCIKWAPGEAKNQTTTILLSKLPWLPPKTSIVDLIYDRPMNLMIWTASDGSAYAITSTKGDESDEKTFNGFRFHTSTSEGERAVKISVNARFSLIAVGCENGETLVYTARDYTGNIPLVLKLAPVVSQNESGPITELCYSPDGFCLFIGFENGWSMWSVFGKAGANSFGDASKAYITGDSWLTGVETAAWIGGGAQLLVLSPEDSGIWSIDMLKSAATSCFSAANIARSLLQTSSALHVYRGHGLENPTALANDSSLWQVIEIPSSYLAKRWPLRSASISDDGRYIAVAGKKGLAHYSLGSGRWKGCDAGSSNVNDTFSVRGGMCWYQHLLIVAIDAGGQYELRLYSRESTLNNSSILHREVLSHPVVLLSISGESSLLVYTYENILYHYIITTSPVGLVLVGQMGFQGIVRAPARVRAINWILPPSQIAEGDPSQDVKVASVLFLVDGKLVMLQPSTSEEGDVKYDLKVVAQNVEFFMLMRDVVKRVEEIEPISPTPTEEVPSLTFQGLEDSLWVFDGIEVKVWINMDETIEALSKDSIDFPSPISISVDSYPLTVLLKKGLLLGAESEVQTRSGNVPSSMRVASQKFVEDGNHQLAHTLSQSYDQLPYYSHALELLLHNVLDEEVDSPTGASRLPAIIEFVSNSSQYLDIIVQCTRKTEVRSWKTLFAHLPPAIELFDESLRRNMLKTAGGYLLVLHNLDSSASHTLQTQQLFSRAVASQDWDLCKELARFLAALDTSGSVLREAMEGLNIKLSTPEPTTSQA